MDFLDPEKQKAHARRLIAGYILIGMVVLLSAIILLYQAFGYSIDRHGRIFQNGLVFISSLPDRAEIYVDGMRESSTTNARLALPAGQYVFEIKREGYRTWK
ncbi:MAG TPA: PEGA domain-containing protein, partial [Candidatus Saccharimonadales bacterium]|nr:PEGA domain-containing protein [Candidatus Saccharimonadales bacterium]